MWDQLPELILTQIFGHLDRADRANVGQVCRSWNRTLSSPVLWRSMTVFIDRDLRGDFSLTGELTVRLFSDAIGSLRISSSVNLSQLVRGIEYVCKIIINNGKESE